MREKVKKKDCDGSSSEDRGGSSLTGHGVSRGVCAVVVRDVSGGGRGRGDVARGKKQDRKDALNEKKGL